MQEIKLTYLEGLKRLRTFYKQGMNMMYGYSGDKPDELVSILSESYHNCFKDVNSKIKKEKLRKKLKEMYKK